MSVSMREMLEAGCHFGHQTRFWNPKMAQYIFGARNKIHIINLEKTVEKFAEAEKFIRELSARGGKVLFVDTKRGGRDTIVEQAQRAGCCYVDQRWLGGTLTNFKTVKQTIKHLKDMEQTIADGGLEKMSKKEALDFTREIEKLNNPSPLAELAPGAVQSHWADIREEIGRLPDPGALDALYLSAGCARRVADIGVDEALEKQGIEYHPYMRHRISLMRLLPMLELR